ncbi:flavonoid 3',5'-hydroxylase 1-like [Prosopis cineraria]|uniref:flavonoid 3',5'-hydroxylase 1-like n=1 Tax=Prosopis cineraria TaxID=364024 RepID=UPI00240F59A7|nr:flavonoid 3',5'-hydroxylase 1-like [Prosopis cineraria]
MAITVDALLLRELGVAILIFIITRFSIRFLLNLHHHHRHDTKKLPPGPKGWPVLGAIPLLGPKPHVTFTNMAKKYGPIMYLKMGPCHTVVASTSDAARAFLKTLDLNFSNRPVIAGSTYLRYNTDDLVFHEYGPKWKLMRKLSNLHILGKKALDDWSDVRGNEVKHMVGVLCEFSRKNEAVKVRELLSYVITNILSQAILSRRMFQNEVSECKEFKDMVVEFMVLSGMNIGDFMPRVNNWIDLKGLVRKMKRLHERFDALLKKMVEDHETTLDYEGNKKADFLDILMANREEASDEEGGLNFTNIKAILLNFFTAGTHSSSSTIIWALTEMLKNPNILKKAQREIDQVVGKERLVLESDLQNLPYLQAICKETYRLHPSTPLSIPRISTQACEINGYYIPKNTWLSVNIYAIGRDPNVWDDPLEFKPERFMMSSDGKINEKMKMSLSGTVDFELIPFGGGRRVCAGYRMAMVVVQLILGTLVHSFDWKLPDEEEDGLNMEEVFGITVHKAVPLSAMVSPRLLPHAYK